MKQKWDKCPKTRLDSTVNGAFLTIMGLLQLGGMVSAFGTNVPIETRKQLGPRQETVKKN